MPHGEELKNLWNYPLRAAVSVTAAATAAAAAAWTKIFLI